MLSLSDPVNSFHARKALLLALAGLVVISFLLLSAYSNTLESPPMLDDTHSFVDEPLIQNFDWSTSSVLALSRSKFGWQRFIPMLTLANDSWRGKGKLAPFHITNIFIHLLTTLAVFFWAKLLFTLAFQDRRCKDGVGVVLAALAVSGIWSLVPIQTNAVTYIVQRMASLAAFFYIVSFTAYFHGRLSWISDRKKTALLLWIVAFVSFGAGLVSKENTVTLPIVIILAEVLFFWQPFYDCLGRHKRIVVVISVLGTLLVLVAFIEILPSVLSGFDRRHFTLGERLLTELRVVSSYISLLLLPLPSRLCLDHHVALSRSLFVPTSTLFSLFFLLFGVLLSWILRRRYALLSFGILWFFLNLVLESSFIALELKFEHRLYLPSCGFYLFLVGAGIAALERFPVVVDRRVLLAALLIAFSMLSLMTFKRNLVWADSITLYEDCVKKAFLKPRVHSNLSKAYSVAGHHEKAVAEAEKAIELGIEGYEEYWVSACNLISAYTQQGLKDKALACGIELLEEAPETAKMNAKPIFLRNLAVLYEQRGEYRKAYETLYSAMELLTRSSLPFLPALERDMLILLENARKNGDDNVLEHLALADRKKSSVLLRMAEIFFELGDMPRAREYASQALGINDVCEKCKEFVKNLDEIEVANLTQLQYGTFIDNYVKQFWRSSFNFKMAITYVIEKYHLSFLASFSRELIENAKHLKPDSPDPWLLDSWCFYSEKKYDKAIGLVRKGLQIDENYAQLWVNLGMYQLAGQYPQQSLMSLKKALQLYPGYPRRNQVVAMIEASREKIR